jgi:tetratricopeptide (TPR) repeat protein
MSLLLDALKSSESNYAAAGEPETEDQEESLDARATLELLAAQPAAREALSLTPVTEPIPAAPPAIAKAPLSREPASTPSYRATAAAPTAPRPTNKLSVVLMALVVLGGVGFAVKLLWPKPYVIATQDGAQPPPPAAAAAAEANPVSLHAVQVPSERPVDRFAYTGNAPEIDLHETSQASPAMASPATAPGESPPPRRHAAAALTVTRTESEPEIYGHVKAGYQALGAGNIAGAQREYLAALQIDPNNIDALLGIAAAAARDGKPAMAGETYLKVLKLEPGNPDATAAIAMLSRDASANESAESHLKILIGGDDGSRPALHAALGGVYAADGRWSEAAQEYFAALGRDPGNPDLAFDVAASLDQNRNAAMAINFYQQALTFARQRPAQFDVHLVEERVNRLQARAAAARPDAAGASEAR